MLREAAVLSGSGLKELISLELKILMVSLWLFKKRRESESNLIASPDITDKVKLRGRPICTASKWFQGGGGAGIGPGENTKTEEYLSSEFDRWHSLPACHFQHFRLLSW